ncbi:MAG: class I SAM-dependent methyltransferase [Actinomycetota bacterium]|jgi:ubiquinone/menaquinone biosynthesis C-methylase UbiE|nr:class I SAM-dependent methyltransferase [Actinomycetota bacterium]
MGNGDAPAFDKDKAKAFGGQVVNVLNAGATAIMMSIGHKTGLFDSMDGQPPRTVDEIADAAGLHPRPVLEWLSALSCAGVVEYDAAGETFVLPPEHAGLLTRRSGPLNLAVQAQYVGLLGAVEDPVADAFEDGSGVPYDLYPNFQAIMAQSSGERQERTLVNAVVPILPGGREVFEAGIDVADVGCGTGKGMVLLGREFPNSRFTGYDFSADAVEAARGRVAEAGIDNVRFEVADAAELDVEEEYDLVATFDAIHDQSRPAEVLAAIHQMLRPGGTYLCVEPKASSELAEMVDEPMAPFLYTMSTMHCMQVSLAYGGNGLGAAWGHQTATEYLERAGFVDIEMTGVREDRANNFFISQRAAQGI